ncbi:BamA/TamA family outer membrane protein [Atlantibacter hermannii]|uniref:BamA/TamA family outer membrane protein n=1 Tax=Atlantibacter hermannii TaxID=565 RepID=UPI00164F6AFB|nr:BamA/TamA family outer membrane protein [Atlantibacter hermannii]
MNRACRVVLVLTGCLALFRAQAATLSRQDIDALLQKLGDGDTASVKSGIDWGVMPGPFYTPLLGPGIGAAAVGQYRPDVDDKTGLNATLSVSGYVSTTGAFGVTVQNYASFAGDRWRFYLDGSLSDTPTWYWGQGFTAGDRNDRKQKYTAQLLDLHPMIYRRLAQNVYAGIGWWLDAHHAARISDDDPPLIASTPQGSSSLSSGGSLEINWDDRDFIPNPRTGQYADLRYSHFSPGTGSDTRFEEYQLHYSRYQPLNEKSVLAWEMEGAFTQGEVPWNMLPLLGGNHRMRGYYEGRYRDKNVISGQIEYRRDLSWRHGVVGWLGAGTMGPSFSSLNNGRWLPSTGIGYRFAFKPRINVRLDYGIGKGSSGFYFQVGEAF